MKTDKQLAKDSIYALSTLLLKLGLPSVKIYNIKLFLVRFYDEIV